MKSKVLGRKQVQSHKGEKHHKGLSIDDDNTLVCVIFVAVSVSLKLA